MLYFARQLGSGGGSEAAPAPSCQCAAAAAPAGELITADRPRVKFEALREGSLSPPRSAVLADLAALMAELEAAGLTPTLNDGLSAGNCAVAASCVDGSGGGHIFVSRSGKPPGAALAPADWVLLTQFDPEAWTARYRSAAEGAAPTSDAPLHAAVLAPGAAGCYGWAEQPLVAVHGHALAEGAGEAGAVAAGGGGACGTAAHARPAPRRARLVPTHSAPRFAAPIPAAAPTQVWSWRGGWACQSASGPRCSARARTGSSWQRCWRRTPTPATVCSCAEATASSCWGPAWTTAGAATAA